MILPPLESSWWDDSNGGKNMFLALILEELRYYKCLTIIDIGVRSSDWIWMNLPPYESSYRDDSNGVKIIQNGSLDAELPFIKFPKYNSAKIKVNSGQIFSQYEINYGTRN